MSGIVARATVRAVGDELVLRAVPQLHRDPDGVEAEAPRLQVRASSSHQPWSPGARPSLLQATRYEAKSWVRAEASSGDNNDAQLSKSVSGSRARTSSRSCHALLSRGSGSSKYSWMSSALSFPMPVK